MNTSQSTAGVKMWLADPLPPDVRSAIDRLARTDDAVRIAVMPDVHLAREVCVGTVLATRRLIYPEAVGGDIGCGMAALAFDASADLLRNESAAGAVLANLPRFVPAMKHPRRDVAPSLDEKSQATALDSSADAPAHPAAWPRNPLAITRLDFPLSDPRLESIRRRDGVVQLGTLGRGNHFLEFQADEEDRLWLMIHSGSRAMGPDIRDWHLKSADKSATGLRYLDSQTPAGQAYLADMAWARAYARCNRRAMMDATARLIYRLFKIAPIDASAFDCDHNHVQRERHIGEEWWIHRKGAAAAGAGQIGIIPGSMGTESYHVAGRGCAEALGSSSHGAGRSMSRADARRRVSDADLGRQLENVWYDQRIENSLREEAPSAYKDIRRVMRAQRDLTRITRKLRPIVSYKSG